MCFVCSALAAREGGSVGEGAVLLTMPWGNETGVVRMGGIGFPAGLGVWILGGPELGNNGSKWFPEAVEDNNSPRSMVIVKM